MSNCTCGRTTRAPFCDNSHALTEQEYQERTQRLAELVKYTPKHEQKPDQEPDARNSV